MSRGRAWGAALAILLIALAIGTIAGASIGTPPPTHSPASATASGVGAGAVPLIARSDLPPEARSTLERIAAGGPFPYSADGATFENRERLLPIRPAGTYREYTVATPGSADRGARRIVIASSGESYWSPDHYATFFRIEP